jgi:hypothetical protein
MIVYVCKNHDDDGDLCLTVFTTKYLAAEFCRINPTFAYYDVEITDDLAKEIARYEMGML